MKIGCLFGSGISLKAGYKCVSQITDIILSGEEISHQSDSRYYFLPPAYSNTDENVNRIINFLKFLHNENKQYNEEFKSNPTPSYEDLFYTVRQIHDEINGEQENFIVRKYIQNIDIDSVTMLQANSSLFNDFTVNDLINETMTYINNVVTILLYKPPNDISYLSIIKDILSKHDIEIFSINHDLLLETYFELNKITYCDGFSNPKGDIKHFDSKLFSTDCNIKLYKLHGSSNWHRYRYNGTDWRGDFIGKPTIPDIHHTKDENGIFLAPIESTTKILIGTFNKLIDYNSGIFSDLFCMCNRC